MLSEKLDGTVRKILEAVRKLDLPSIESLTPVEARQRVTETRADLSGAMEPLASIENLRIPGPNGRSGGEIPVRVYTPETRSGAGIVYFHGGGWVVCNLDTHDVPCSAIAHRAGAVVVAVDYRLAPEHKFPAAVEDAWTALRWVAANSPRLGIDPNQLCVCGDSAGGNLGAVMALKSRDENGPRIAFQALVYPVTDLSSFETGSYDEFAEDHYLTRSMMQWFRDHYLADSSDARNPDASPLLARDLHGLPPALVITAECDPLRDEGEAYAKRLRDAGVEVTETRYAGMIHPFFSLAGALPQALDAYQQIADAVKAVGLRSSARAV
jgi:acetyl esterase